MVVKYASVGVIIYLIVLYYKELFQALLGA